MLKQTLKNCLVRIAQCFRRTIAKCAMSLTLATTMPLPYTSIHRTHLQSPHPNSRATISASTLLRIRLLPGQTHHTRTRSNASKPTNPPATSYQSIIAHYPIDHRQTTPTSTPPSHRKATAAADHSATATSTELPQRPLTLHSSVSKPCALGLQHRKITGGVVHILNMGGVQGRALVRGADR